MVPKLDLTPKIKDPKKRYFGLRGFKLNLAIAVIAGLDFTLFGYDQGVLGGLLTLKGFLAYFPQIDTANPPPGRDTAWASNIQAITVGGYTLGFGSLEVSLTSRAKTDVLLGFFGAVATIKLGNILGRRRTIFFGSLVMIVGASIQAASFSLVQLVVSRFITGIGNGMNTSTVPMWQSETSKSHRRGQLVMVEGSLIVFGVMISYWIDLGFSFIDPNPVAWRFPIAFQIVIALIIASFVLFLPESPRWLVLKGRKDEALEVLCALNDRPPDDPALLDEFHSVEDTAIAMSAGGFADCFKMNRDRNFHRTALAYVNQMFQQISGINIITYYAATIFEQSIGLSPFISRLLAALNGTVYFASSIIAIFTIEKLGRRTLMLFGATGQCLTMIVLAVTTAPQYGNNKNVGIAAAAMLFVFNFFFAVGWLGMTWLYPAEVTPLSIRAPANALATTANWLFNFMVVMMSPPAFANIGNKTYIIFAVINAVMVPSVYFFFPETAYRSLEEMDEIFHKTTNPFNVVKIAHDLPHRYGKKGELLIKHDDTEEGQAGVRRRSSAAPADTKYDEGAGEKTDRL